MKKVFTILAAVLLIAGLHSKALAQSDASTTTASANVVQSLEVGAESQNLDFGNMLAGTAKTIDDADGAITLVNGEGVTGGEQRGYISIETADGSSVDLSLIVPSNLQDGSNTLTADFEVGLGPSLTGRVTDTKPTGTQTVDIYSGGAGSDFSLTDGVWSLDSPIIMPASGTLYLVLGGEVSADENQPVGNYLGDVTLTATITD